jgi:hypothetical protein
MSDRLAAIEKKRAEKAAKAAEARDEQKATDLEQITAYQDSNPRVVTALLETPHFEGLPVVVAVRCPSKIELKRYRDTVRNSPEGKPVQNLEAAEALAGLTVVYPEDETFEKMNELLPGLKGQAGMLSAKLAIAAQTAEGKG